MPFVQSWPVAQIGRLRRNSSNLVDFECACANFVRKLIHSRLDGGIIARVIQKSMSEISCFSRLSSSPRPCKSINNGHTLTLVLGFHPGLYNCGLSMVIKSILHDYGTVIYELFGRLAIRIAWSNTLPAAHVRLRKL